MVLALLWLPVGTQGAEPKGEIPWKEFPPLPVGTVKIFEGLEGGLHVEERVIRVEPTPEGILLELEDQVEYIQMPRVVNRIQYLLSSKGPVFKVRVESSFSGKTHEYRPPLRILEFPLEVGKTWSYQEGNNRVTYEVVGIEKITVPAGTFQAMVLRKTRVFDLIHREETQQEEEYYAPGVGFVGNRIFSGGKWIWARRLVEIRREGVGHE